MKANVKAKWIVGISGAALSAFVLGQLNDQSELASKQSPDLEITKSMSEREIELVKLDWSNFSIQTEQNVSRSPKNDRTTRRT